MNKEENVATFYSADDYDAQWEEFRDFITFNPGARHRRRITLQLLEKISFQTCLDVGCGTGELLRVLISKYPKVQFKGVDFSEQTMARNGQLFPACSFAHLDIEKGALPEKFDLVVCSEVVEHLHNRPKAFEHLASMVKPGGHLLITAPTGKVFQTEKYFGHTTHPTLTELRGHATNNNLEISEFVNWGFPIYCGVRIATNINPQFSMKNFASGPYTWSQKLVCNVLYWLNFLNFRRHRYGCQIFCLMRKLP